MLKIINNIVKPFENVNRFQTINSFKQIDLDSPNTLVICDIDNTLLYWDKKDPADFYSMLKHDFPYFTEEQIHKEALGFVQMYNVIIAKPKLTDSDGFNEMIKKIADLKSEIIFLTARNVTSAEYTKKNFKDIGLTYSNYQVHYTDNSITKGEYIKKNINITKYNKVIFIDDYECYIKTVQDLLPQIICYKFVIKN